MFMQNFLLVYRKGRVIAFRKMIFLKLLFLNTATQSNNKNLFVKSLLKKAENCQDAEGEDIHIKY